MAVETDNNKSTIKVNGAVPNVAAASASRASGPISDAGRRKRASSLMKVANTLPTVEHSLEEFIAKANQTLVDVDAWQSADALAKEEDVKRKEQDATRWKQAEVQMREGDAREQSLRRQLDGLQGKLAEAEARAAVAGTQVGSAAHDQTIGELKTQIEKAMLRMRAAEEKSNDLQKELHSSKTEARAATGSGASSMSDEDADERVRAAEAKATKAIAAARAAAAGLTVSNADLAAIESGLAVEQPVAAKQPQSPMMWIAVAALAVAGTVVVLFLAGVLGSKPAPAPAPAPAAVVQPAPAPVAVEPAPAPAPAPVTATAPTPTPAAVDPTPAPATATAPVVTPIEEPTAAPTPAVAEPVVVAPAVVEKPVAKPTKTVAKPTKTDKPKTDKPAKGDKASTVVDPFGDAPAKPEKKKPAKPTSSVVDPF